MGREFEPPHGHQVSLSVWRHNEGRVCDALYDLVGGVAPHGVESLKLERLSGLAQNRPVEHIYIEKFLGGADPSGVIFLSSRHLPWREEFYYVDPFRIFSVANPIKKFFNFFHENA